MGMLASQPESAIHHFSHPHPLQLSNYQPQQTLCLASCSGCKLKASGWMYTCQQCNYFLHISCSQMPQQISHPCDQNHVLSLLSKPIYPEGLFNCDACGNQGNGFSYHCGACHIDLHPTCATMPLVLNHQSHHHQLNLIFSVPYLNKTFCCDICSNLGSKQWLYRCNLCEFDAHLDCTTITPEPRSAPVQAPIQQVQVQYYQTAPRSAIPRYQVVETPLTTSPLMQNFVPNNYVNNTNASAFGSNMSMPVGRSSEHGTTLVNQVIQNLVSSSSQSLGQTLVQGLLGIGGGGSNSNGNSAGIDLGGIIGGGGDGGLLLSLSGIDIGGLMGAGIGLGGSGSS